MRAILLVVAAALVVYVAATVRVSRGVMDPKTGRAVVGTCETCATDSAKVLLFKLGK